MSVPMIMFNVHITEYRYTSVHYYYYQGPTNCGVCTVESKRRNSGHNPLNPHLWLHNYTLTPAIHIDKVIDLKRQM